MTADTLGDSLRILMGFYKLIMPAVNASLKEESNTYRVIAEIDVDFGKYNDLIIELCLGSSKKFADEITGEDLPFTLEFSHPPIWDVSEEVASLLYSKFFKCDVKFNCKRSALTGNATIIESTRTKASNKILHNYAKTVLLRKQKNESIKISLAEKARNILKESAKKDEHLDLNGLAEKLRMSSRTLSRNLAKDDIQYKELANEVRFNRAKHLLKNSNLSMERLAIKLGYSNITTFSRAFKIHTGETPSQWRP